MNKTIFLTGIFLGALAIILGAFGAHGLEEKLDADAIQTFETGVKYQMYHALALMLVAILISRFPNSILLTVAGYAFVAGIFIFSGSLYALTLTGIKWLGAITPIGGLAFIIGWLCLALATWRIE